MHLSVAHLTLKTPNLQPHHGKSVSRHSESIGDMFYCIFYKMFPYFALTFPGTKFQIQ